MHGDYAKKNMLIGPSGRWVIDHEVAHFGNPVFDVAFFLSFVVLSAVRWQQLRDDMRRLGDTFLDAYHATAGAAFRRRRGSDLGPHRLPSAGANRREVAGSFLGDARADAREVGIGMLREPERGLWDWLDPRPDGSQTTEREVDT